MRSPSKIKYILFKKTYPNINISVLCISCWWENLQSLPGFLKYLPKNMALLVQKLLRKKNRQNLFPAILRWKKN